MPKGFLQKARSQLLAGTLGWEIAAQIGNPYQESPLCEEPNASHSAKMLLVLDGVRGARGGVGVHQGRVRILGAVAQQVVDAHASCH